MAQADAQSLDACCAALIALAKAHGSRDNITAVLALVEH
jgi:protein phosphatase